MVDLQLLNSFCLFWFIASWIGYSFFATRNASRKSASLSSILHYYRLYWVRRIMLREHRVSDAALLGNLEKSVNFFASTTILILAGLLTALNASRSDFDILVSIPFAFPVSESAVKFKLLFLVGIFVYAFFTFTWSIRQFNFFSTLVGAAPVPGEAGVSVNQREIYAGYATKILDEASNSFNYGLRSYYFSLAFLFWFYNPWLFIIATSSVVFILYRREFNSKPLKAMVSLDSFSETNTNEGAKVYNLAKTK